MKDKKRLIVIAAFLFLGALAVWNSSSNKHDQSDSTNSVTDTSGVQIAMHEEYPDLSENNQYVKESYSEVRQRFESGTGIIFLGFKECPWCQKMAPILNEAAEAEKVNIHYLDIRQLYSEDPAAYEELVTYLSPHLIKDEKGSPRIQTPDISFVKDGEIVWRYKMDAISDEERYPDIYWTEARRERTIQTFRDQIKLIKEG